MLNRIRTATKGAIGNIQKRKYGNVDNQLQVYNSLTPKDFGTMMTKFGADNVMDYIKTMEGKRLRGRRQ
jgi:hypothetical protein